MPNPKAGARMAVYPGSFDPITLGHLDVIRRGRRLFDRLVIAVGRNPGKAHLFTAEERVEMAEELPSAIVRETFFRVPLAPGLAMLSSCQYQHCTSGAATL